MLARVEAVRAEGVVHRLQRLRSFTTGVTEVQYELRDRHAKLDAQVSVAEERTRALRSALRRVDMAARESLRQAGGLLSSAELDALLSLLPQTAAARVQARAEAAALGEWDKRPPERRLTRRAQSIAAGVLFMPPARESLGDSESESVATYRSRAIGDDDDNDLDSARGHHHYQITTTPQPPPSPTKSILVRPHSRPRSPGGVSFAPSLENGDGDDDRGF